MMIAVIGGDNAPQDVVPLAEQTGREIAERGHTLVCGGRGGVMEAACRGAQSAGGHTIGILPGPDRSDANSCVEFSIVTNLGAARNVIVVLTADAIIAIDGSYGTLSEIALAWVLKRPVVAVAVPGWSLELGGRRLDHRGRRADGTEDQVFAAADARAAIALVEEQLPRHPRRHDGVRRGPGTSGGRGR